MAHPDRSQALPKVPPHDPIVAAIEPALKAGAAFGVAGFIYGGASGIVRGLPPSIAGIASAVHFFALSTTFNISRSVIIQAWAPVDQNPLPKDLNKASAIAGGISGSLYGLIGRSRWSAIPGSIILSLVGYGGQRFYNNWTAPKETRPGDNFWKRMGDKSWVPFKVLTNEEYSAMLQEKMLKLDVEIAVTEDKIAALKKQAVEENRSSESSP